MLVIFDIDGTLLGGETRDWAAFDRALNEVLGFVPSAEFIDALHDVTAATITDAVFRETGASFDLETVYRIRDLYGHNLRQVFENDPSAFPARPGVMDLLTHLRSLNYVSVAVATGDWHPTISYKLSCAGLDLTTLPMATASDAMHRPEIIALAAERAGRSLKESVYVGDGLWDLRACRELDIPFIGTGDRVQQLTEAGAQWICEDLHVDPFTRVLDEVTQFRARCSA